MTAVSIRELSRRLGVSDTAINNARAEGRLPDSLFGVKPSGRPYVLDVDHAESVARDVLTSHRAGVRRADKFGEPDKTYKPKTNRTKELKIKSVKKKADAVKPVKASKPEEKKTVDITDQPRYEPKPDYQPPPQDFQTPQSPQQYQRARAVRETFAAKLAEIEYQEKSGLLVSRDRVKILLFNAGRICRDALTQMPNRIGAQIAAEKDPHAVQVILTEEINQVLSDLSDSISAIADY